MSVRPRDTDAAAWTAQSTALDRMGGPGRLLAAFELSDAVREIRLAGLRSRHPDLSRRQLIRRVVWEEYGVELPDPR